MSDSQVCIFRFELDTFDSFDGVGDVGEVDKGAISVDVEVGQCPLQKRQKGKKDPLLLQEINQLNLSKLSKIIF